MSRTKDYKKSNKDLKNLCNLIDTGNAVRLEEILKKERYTKAINKTIRLKLDSQKYTFFSPLEYAIFKGSLECVKILIEAGADPALKNTKNSKIPTPLWAAYYYNQFHISQFLLQNFDNLNINEEITLKSGRKSHILSYIMDTNPEKMPIDEFKLFCLILKRPETNLDYQDAEGRSILDHAVFSYKPLLFLKTLLSEGANPKICDYQSMSLIHHTAYSLATQTNYTKKSVEDLLNFILKQFKEGKIDTNATDSQGWTALGILLEKGAKESTVEFFINELGANINQIMFAGRTLMHSFSESKNTKALENAIKHGAQINTQDSHGLTPLHYCFRPKKLSDVNAINILLNNGADPNILTYRAGSTPLMAAIGIKDHDGIKALLGCDKLKINQKNLAGATALYYAVEVEDYSIFKMLLRHPKIDISAQAPNLQNILHYIVSCGKNDFLKQILENFSPKLGELMHQRDLAGNTPLDIAIMQRDCKSAETLINKFGASLDTKLSDSDLLPLDFAYYNYGKDSDIYKLLEAKGATLSKKLTQQINAEQEQKKQEEKRLAEQKLIKSLDKQREEIKQQKENGPKESSQPVDKTDSWLAFETTDKAQPLLSKWEEEAKKIHQSFQEAKKLAKFQLEPSVQELTWNIEGEKFSSFDENIFKVFKGENEVYVCISDECVKDIKKTGNSLLLNNFKRAIHKGFKHGNLNHTTGIKTFKESKLCEVKINDKSRMGCDKKIIATADGRDVELYVFDKFFGSKAALANWTQSKEMQVFYSNDTISYDASNTQLMDESKDDSGAIISDSSAGYGEFETKQDYYQMAKAEPMGDRASWQGEV